MREFRGTALGGIMEARCDGEECIVLSEDLVGCDEFVWYLTALPLLKQRVLWTMV